MRRRELMLLLGGAMIAARALRAQQKAMPVIGYLGNTSFGTAAPFCGRATPGVERKRLCRGTKFGDRLSLGRGVAMIGCPHWPPTSSPARST